MPVLISSVASGSPAENAGIHTGDTLVSINSHSISDVLDYRFYMTERTLTLELLRGGAAYTARVSKGEYEELGLSFDSYLMDKQKSCKNKCIFCFIDQLPPGMRDTLYFKDDDSRLSFLFGNYITLTNLTDADVERIITMRISPVNVSVHTTDPALRIQMMKNPRSGDSLRYLYRLCEGGIQVNTQLVLCPGINDGEALDRTLSDLGALYPQLQSIACVPVGLTRFRQKLAPLSAYDRAGALDTVQRITRFSDEMLKRHGARVAYASDEFYLKAQLPIPQADYYGEFAQLENGVGLVSLLRDEFRQALAEDEGEACSHVNIATGTAATPLLQELAQQAMQRHPQVKVDVHPIINHFFGEGINVAGLITGQDLAQQLKGRVEGQTLLLPAVMLRREGDRFLDDMTVEQLAEHLHANIFMIENDGYRLYDAMTGKL